MRGHASKWKQQWIANYQALKVYHRIHGHVKIRRTKEPKLHSWIHTQRRRYRTAAGGDKQTLQPLSRDEYEKLAALGVEFDPCGICPQGANLKMEDPEISDSAGDTIPARAPIQKKTKKKESQPHHVVGETESKTDRDVAVEKEERSLTGHNNSICPTAAKLPPVTDSATGKHSRSEEEDDEDEVEVVDCDTAKGIIMDEFLSELSELRRILSGGKASQC